LQSHSEITCRIIGFFDYHIVQCSVRRIYILEFGCQNDCLILSLSNTEFCAHCVINCCKICCNLVGIRAIDGFSTGSSVEYFSIRAQDARVSRKVSSS
jgi:hypothetical protein